MSEDHEFEAQLEALREKFRERLVTYRDRLLEGRTLLAQSATDAALRKLKAVSHELAGAGGTFGYPELSEVAIELETAADDALAGNGRADGVIAPLRQLIREVELSL